MTCRRWVLLYVETSLVLLSFFPKVCRPWTGPIRHSRNKKGTKSTPSTSGSKLYYKSNNTAGPFISSNVRAENITVPAYQRQYPVASDFGDTALLQLPNPPALQPLRTPQQYDNDNRGLAAVQNAIQQVHAIMDLYQVTQQSISHEIILSTLDGVVHKVFVDKAHLSSAFGGDSILEDLEKLVFRLVEKLGVPWTSKATLKTLLAMRKQSYRRATLLHSPSASSSSLSPSSGTPSLLSCHDPQSFMDNAARLLLLYYQGVAESTPSSEASDHYLPHEDTLDVFRFANTYNGSMTDHLWELQHVIRHHGAYDDRLVRDTTTEALLLLARSDSSHWQDRGFDMLVKMEMSSQASRNSTLFRPKDKELDVMLSSASRSGNVQRATWIFRQLYDRRHSSTSTDRLKLWCQLMNSYAQSNHPGSVSYMERLLKTHKEARHRDTYNILLRARSQQQLPGTGSKAEEVLNEMMMHASSTDSSSSSIEPNFESLYYVALTYLKEEPTSFQNILDADMMVRRVLAGHNMTRSGGSSSNNNSPWPIMERILQAYASVDHDKAMQVAVDFFRFFLVHHSKGQITERPTAKHLSYLFAMLERKPSKKSTKTKVELGKLVDGLPM